MKCKVIILIGSIYFFITLYLLPFILLVNNTVELHSEVNYLRDSVNTLSKIVRLEQITLQSIKQIESQHDTSKVGDKGKAFGCLQIHKCCVDEVNRCFSTNFKHHDMFLEQKCDSVFWLTMKHLSQKYYKKHKQLPTWDELIQSWNGGSIRNTNTRKYLYKVQNEIKQQYEAEVLSGI